MRFSVGFATCFSGKVGALLPSTYHAALVFKSKYFSLRKSPDQAFMVRVELKTKGSYRLHFNVLYVLKENLQGPVL